MSFETLLWLGLTLLFVLAPAFSNKNRRKQGQDQQPPGPQGQAGPDAAGSGQHDRPQPGSFESRLEEARRRIEAAVSEQERQVAGTRGTGSQGTSPAAQPGRKLVSNTLTRTISVKPVAAAPQQQQSARIDWQQSGIDWQAAPRKYPPAGGGAALASKRASEERSRRLKQTGSELQVTTLQGARTYTGRREAPDAQGMFSRKALLSGYIWHQVLSAPPHKSGTRRRVSRLRSP